MYAMNILAYAIYLLITYLITFKVGLIFYRNGRVFVFHLLKQDAHLTSFINRVLLVCYYLLNIGYATIMISFWQTVTNWAELLASVTKMTGSIMLTLSIIHFFNMSVIYFLGKKNKSFTYSKTEQI